MKREFYRISEISELIGMSKRTIRRRITEGRIRAIKNDGKNGSYLIPVEEYNNYIKSLGV